MKRITFILKNLKYSRFQMYFILMKTDFCTGVQIKAKRLSWHEIVGQLCDVRLHENEFYATKSQAI